MQFPDPLNLSGDDSFRMKAIPLVLYEDWRLMSRMVTTPLTDQDGVLMQLSSVLAPEA